MSDPNDATLTSERTVIIDRRRGSAGWWVAALIAIVALVGVIAFLSRTGTAPLGAPVVAAPEPTPVAASAAVEVAQDAAVEASRSAQTAMEGAAQATEAAAQQAGEAAQAAADAAVAAGGEMEPMPLVP